MVLDGFFNAILGWVNVFGTPWNVITVSFIITFLITLSYKYLTNQVEMKELKGKMKELQARMKEDKTNQEVQKEFMSTQMGYMKHSFKPMLYTFLPLILIFGWMRETFNSGAEILSWSINIPLLGTGFGWLGTYILSSIIFSMIIRRVMKIN
jgi:uncharacterized membrane protein (DUF106 family)